MNFIKDKFEGETHEAGKVFKDFFRNFTTLGTFFHSFITVHYGYP